MTSENAAPAEMPGEEERFAAAYLGFNPHDSSTWAVDIVNRLVRIRAERGDQAFVQEVANLVTPPAETVEHWKARALAAEAALAAERAMLKRIVDLHADWRLCMPKDWEGDPLSDACEDAAAAIRAQDTP